MQKKDVDVTLSLAVIVLLFLGLVMIGSVSIYPSYTHTYKYMVLPGYIDEPYTTYFLYKTFQNVLIGIIAMAMVSKIPYHLLEKYVKPIFWGSVVFLCLVFVPGIGDNRNGATGWLDIPGLPSIQPVEFAKLGLIIMLAFFLKKRRSLMKDFYAGFLAFFIVVGFIVFPLMLQPDFGSILILAPVVLAMYYIGGGNFKYIGIAFVVGLIGIASVYGIGKMQQNNYKAKVEAWIQTGTGGGISLGYITTRIDNYFRNNKEIAQTRDRGGSDHQLKNAFIALGSGGFSGLGFGASIQKFGYLPEVHGDFIFAVIVEELGFIGGLGIIIFYLFIAYRGYSISRWVKDLFAKYLAFGITTWFIIQAFVNIGVNLNVIPLTWVTLPFVSFGGSSILSLCIATGVLLSVSRHVEVKPQNLSEALQAGRKVTF